jgi:hypothetical protein
MTMDDTKDSNRVRVTKETTAGIEWKGRVENVSKGEGGGGSGGGVWWINVGDEAKDENAQPPWEFDDKEPMEEIHVVMGVGTGAATVANAANPHQRNVNVNRNPDGDEDGDVNDDDDKGAAHMMDALRHGGCCGSMPSEPVPSEL